MVAPSMPPLRHPGAPRLIEWTGERCVPWAEDPAIVYEHFHRYLWAAAQVASGKVLDVGSGEGFGAAILARSAGEVTGIDVDERAVEHAAANYAAANLSFQAASALDLSRFADGSFDAVVAFEMIEHVADHERLMGELTRVLAPDGLLLVSTPEKDLYSAAAGQVNDFHEHELTRREFESLLHERFGHVAIWGQRTIAGSLLSSLDPELSTGAPEAFRGLFFLEPAGGEWEIIEEPAPLFCVAAASRRPLKFAPIDSTLADTTLELLRTAERSGAAAVAERDGLLAEANALLAEKRQEALVVAEKVSQLESQLLAQGDELWETRVELDDERQFRRRVEESVSWQTFQRARGRLYDLIGADSGAARAFQSALRRIGRPPGGK
jgi:SAM-dependent methyltransferase